jgi:hypothetical protein
MWPSQDFEFPKIAYILRKMLEFPVFWNLNISRKKNSFELKFSGHSAHK